MILLWLLPKVCLASVIDQHLALDLTHLPEECQLTRKLNAVTTFTLEEAVINDE